MGRYILRRLLQAIPVVFFSTFLVFMVIHLIPGDAAVATHVRGRLEWLISTIQSLWLAIPNFWAGILAIIFFSLVLHWLPPGGRIADGNDLGNSIKSLILPSTTLALYLAAGRSRFIKFNLLECSSTTSSAPRGPRASVTPPWSIATPCAMPCCR